MNAEGEAVFVVGTYVNLSLQLVHRRRFQFNLQTERERKHSLSGKSLGLLHRKKMNLKLCTGEGLP